MSYGILAVFIFGGSISLLWIQTTEKTMAHYLIIMLFLIFIAIAIIALMKFKQITLTNKELIIRHPLLFRTDCYLLSDIIKMHEADYEINPKIQHSRWSLHEGKITTVTFRSADAVLIFNTFETKKYSELMTALKQAIKIK